MSRLEQLKLLKAAYEQTLRQDIVPFWLKHSIDRQNGGIYNCLDDYGRLLSGDKFLWSQGRALWTFSALYNRIEKKQEWIDLAESIFLFIARHGRDEDGRWMFKLDSEGSVKERDISIYADGFVMNGLGEYYVATGDKKAAQLAVETYENTYSRLQKPGSYGTFPYALPEGFKTHGINMIFGFFYHNLGKQLGRKDISQSGHRLAMEVLNDFYSPQKDAVLEFVTLQGNHADTPMGRACVPGHVLESMWFLIDIFEDLNDKEIIQKCCKLIERHLELGWDDEYKGVLLSIDIDGLNPPYWDKADYKPWWVHVEALVATAYALLHSKEQWCLDWHMKIKQYAFAHYPVPEGEWTQWLDRYGNKGISAALPVKDAFHLPRALIYLISVLGRIISEVEEQCMVQSLSD